MPFQRGQPKPLNSGRKKGQVGLRKELARAGLQSAIEICRQGGEDPISIMMRASRLLNTIAAALAPPSSDSADPEVVRQIIQDTPHAELDFMRKFLVDASDIAAKAAEFGYAKLARVDYVGDQPAGPTRVENKVVFVLNVDSERPGRPIDVDGNGRGNPTNIIDHNVG